VYLSESKNARDEVADLHGAPRRRLPRSGPSVRAGTQTEAARCGSRAMS